MMSMVKMSLLCCRGLHERDVENVWCQRGCYELHKIMMLLMLLKTLRFMVMLIFYAAEEVAYDKDHRGCRWMGRSGRSLLMQM